MKKIVIPILLLLLAPLFFTAPAYSNAVDLILFDNRHYYDANKCSAFIDDLKAKYPGKVILINSSDDFTNYINSAKLYILPNPQSGLSDSEISDLRNFVSNGGSLIAMADWYNYVREDILNEVVDGSGIEFTDTEIIDETNYDYRSYYPLMGELTSYHLTETIMATVSEELKVNGGMLKVNPPAVTIIKSYSTAYVKDESGATVATGSVPFVAISYLGNGIIAAIGGTKLIYTSYFYGVAGWGNKEFMLSLVDWLYNGNGYLGFRLKDRDGSHSLEGLLITVDTSTYPSDSDGINAFSIDPASFPSVGYEIEDPEFQTIVASGTANVNRGGFLDLNLLSYDMNAAGTPYDVATTGDLVDVAWNSEKGELNLKVTAPAGETSTTKISDATKKPIYVKVGGHFIPEVDLADFDSANPDVWCYDKANNAVYVKVQHSSTKVIILGFKSKVFPVGGEIIPVSKTEIILVLAVFSAAIFAIIAAAYKILKKR